MNNKRCAIHKCIPNRFDTYHFPNPKTHLPLFQKWLSVTGNSEIGLLTPDQIYNQFKVCQRHFSPEDLDNELKLLDGAFPALYLPYKETKPLELCKIENTPENVVNEKMYCLEFVDSENRKSLGLFQLEGDSETKKVGNEDLNEVHNFITNVKVQPISQSFDKYNDICICRICLKAIRKEEAQTLIGNGVKTKHVRSMLRELVTIDFTITDNSALCRECVRSISDAYIFKIVCKSSEEKIRTSSTPNKKIVDLFELTNQNDLSKLHETMNKEKLMENLGYIYGGEYLVDKNPNRVINTIDIYEHRDTNTIDVDEHKHTNTINVDNGDDTNMMDANKHGATNNMDKDNRETGNKLDADQHGATNEMEADQHRTTNQMNADQHGATNEMNADQYGVTNEVIVDSDKLKNRVDVVREDIEGFSQDEVLYGEYNLDYSNHLSDLEDHWYEERHKINNDDDEVKDENSAVDIEYLNYYLRDHDYRKVTLYPKTLPPGDNILSSKFDYLFQKKKLPGSLSYHRDILKSRMRRLKRVKRWRGNGPFLCQICGAVINRTSYEYMASHLLKRHSTRIAQSFVCDYCDKSFKKKWNLIFHQRARHSDRIGYNKARSSVQCHVCGKRLAFKTSLVEHMRTHLPNSQRKKFACRICEKLVNTKRTLRKHMALHGLKGEHECKICGKIFNYERSLDRHVQIIHLNKGEYTCKICNVSFYKTETLRAHMKLKHDIGHAGRFRCSFCYKTFFTKSSYDRHVLNKHGDNVGGLLVCQICRYKVRSERSLRQHCVNKHTVYVGEPVCEALTSRKRIIPDLNDDEEYFSC